MKKALALATQILLILSMLIPSILILGTASAKLAALYSRTITINSGQVPSTQTDFPLLVSISNDSNLAAHVANSEGSDI